MNKTNDLTIKVPEEVRSIMERLTEAGYEAYCVGGCVRDSLLGRAPEDWDITTSALPEQVKSLFSNTVDTGIQHGTVMIVRKGTGYEVTTYRIDGEYKDGRHPEQVTFTRSLEEDLKRRDFTINAFAYNKKTGLVDLFGGLDDLEAKVIKAVGDPNKRFEEDALRIMRAIRFSAQLGFSVEEMTYDAISSHSDRLAQVSMDRIRVEFEKTLVSKNSGKVKEFFLLGMGNYILPGYAKRCEDFDEEIAASYSGLGAEERRYLLLADLLRHLSAQEAKDALRKMKYDNQTVTTVSKILQYQDTCCMADKVSIKRALNEQGKEIFFLALQMKEAVAKESFSAIREMAKEILDRQEPYTIGQLAVTGNDLKEEGISEGTKIGETLQRLLDRVILEPDKNTKEDLISMIREQQEA